MSGDAPSSARPTFSALLDRVDARPQRVPVFLRHWPV